AHRARVARAPTVFRLAAARAEPALRAVPGPYAARRHRTRGAACRSRRRARPRSRLRRTRAPRLGPARAARPARSGAHGSGDRGSSLGWLVGARARRPAPARAARAAPGAQVRVDLGSAPII